ncbi:hypothetical protein F4778DRAFT_608454 [Xylariomycetidae sp. FL2044]|nr:hypothetical protein F4778DRAFT_608454 [Xylariomycetidae sp. FL2044]
MPRFTINEPHPTVEKNTYVHAGRGGAGNHFRAPVTTPPSGISSTLPTTPTTTTTPSGRFYSGRGGAGNAHVSTRRPTLSFDEEYRRQAHMEQKPIGHVGRGGAGNVYTSSSSSSSMTTNSRKASDASSQHSDQSSSSSIGSLRSGFLTRLSETFSRH